MRTKIVSKFLSDIVYRGEDPEERRDESRKSMRVYIISTLKTEPGVYLDDFELFEKHIK